jgi:hypothetical protein
MPPRANATSRVAWLLAILSVAATVLTLVLSFDLTGAPPPVSETADFPTRILETQAFVQSRWPLDLAGSLLFAGVFGMIALLGALLFGRTGRVELLGLMIAGGILGMASQLTYIGAHQVAAAIAYCDCGFKTEEVISQTWGLTLIDGVADWILHGAAVLLAGGVIYAGDALAGRGMPAAWGTLSWALAGVLLLSVALNVVGLDGPIGPLLIALVTGVLLPIWAVWLATRLPDPAEVAATF